MDEDVNNFGNILTKCVKENNYYWAVDLTGHILKLFSEGQLPSSLIDYHLLNIFDKNNGLLKFMKTIVSLKEFRQALSNSLDLLFIIVRNIGKRVKKNSTDIIESCKIIVLSNVRADEKVTALKIIDELVSQHLITNDIVIELYENLYRNFQFKKASKVESQTPITLGTIIKNFPYLFDFNDNFAEIVIKCLENEIFDCERTKTKTINSSKGCLIGLSRALESCSSDLTHEQKIKLLNCIESILKTKNERIKTCLRAALDFLKMHMSLFANEIFPRYKEWYGYFIYWLNSNADLNQKSAFYTLLVFYEEIGKISSEHEEGKDVVKTMVNFCIKNVLNESENYLLHISIKGIGYFSKAIYVHMPEKFDGVLVLVSQKMEKKFFLDQNKSKDCLEFLPDYIFTVGSMISFLKDVTDLQMSLIYKSTILMIQLFPKVIQSHQFLVTDTLVTIICNLKQNNQKVLSNFLQIVLYQGIIWTCSYEIAADAEILKENIAITTYKSYMPLWRGLLSINTKNLNADETKLLKQEVFDEMMKHLFVLMIKLNLNTKAREEDNSKIVATDLEAFLEPVKVADIVIFVNVVDFYRELFSLIEKKDFEIFRKWIPAFVDNVIRKSQLNSLSSGFYKLLASCLKLCKKLKYFTQDRIDKIDYVRITYESIYGFVLEILQKIRHFKEDLLISCLEVLMNIPESMVKGILPLAGFAFVSLFLVGRSYLKLTNMAIDTLEEWFELLQNKEIKPFLEEIVPELETYLQSNSLNEKILVDSTLFKTRKTEKDIVKRKVYVESESELLEVQHKILNFLGKLETQICYQFVSSKNKIEPVVFGNKSLLKITLPFEDVKIRIEFEQFVPQILKVALYCSNRKTRIIACELLHTIVVNLLGVSKVANEEDLTDLSILLKEMFVPLLKLACDVDGVVRQIFEPFLLQLMHWYSHSSQRDTMQAEIVKESLLEAITDDSNSALRDFAGVCVKEYVSWTKRQSKNKKGIDVEFWIEKIKTLSKHPDLFKRTGAVLLFNSIYTELRENADIFNTYWLEILNALVTNLSMLDENIIPTEDGFLLQSFASIDHIKRGLIEKSDRFNHPNRDRITPSNFEGDTLKDVAVWILKQTGSLSPHCRLKCMDLFSEIAPKVDNCGSVEIFSKKYLNNDNNNADFLKEVYKVFVFKNDDVFKWMNHFLRAINGHTFVVDHEIFPSEIVFRNDEFFESLNFYLVNLQEKSIDDLLLIKETGNKIVTSIDRQKFKNLKAEIACAFIEFLKATLLRKYYSKSESLHCVLVWNFLKNCIFETNSLGIELTKIEKFHDKVIALLNSMENLNDLQLETITKFLFDYIKENYENDIDMKSVSVSFKQKLILKGVLLLQKTHFAKRLNLNRFFDDCVRDLFEKISPKESNGLFLRINKPIKEYYDLKLQIVLQLDKTTQVFILFDCVFTQDLVTEEGTNNKWKKGRLFYKTFKDTMSKIITNNFNDFIDKLSNYSSEDLFYFNMETLTFLMKYKNSFDNVIIKNVVRKMSESWDEMSEFRNCDLKTIEETLDYLNKLMSISLIPRIIGKSNKMIDWLVDVMDFKDSTWKIPQILEFKSQIIEILPCVTGPDDDLQRNLLSALLRFQEEDFKDKSSSLKSIIPVIIRKVFECLKISKSITILSFCFDLYTSQTDYFEDINLGEIFKDFMKSQNIDFQVNSLKFAWNKCIDNNNKLSNNERYILARDILTLMLNYCLYPTFERFYKEIIQEILKCLTIKDRNDPEYFTSNKVVDRTIIFIVIEILFSRINVDKITENNCPINAEIFGRDSNGKLLLRELTRISLNVGKENYESFVDVDFEIFRLFNCHCYNALVSLIANTQDKIESYSLLFPKDKEGGNICWNKLFDLNKTYDFKIDFDKIPTRIKKMSNIRSSKCEKKERKNNNSFTYLHSQKLFESTLREDITKYDFTNSMVRTQMENVSETNHFDYSESEYLQLDAVDLNEHECMIVFCGLLRHLVDSKLSPLPDENEEICLPPWFNSIRKTLKNEEIPKNVKLFLLKVIENVPDIFQPYAKWFLEPIMEMIVDGLVGKEINYFVADLIIVLLSWSNVAIPDNVVLTTNLLEFLMENVNKSRKALMKEDLNLIKLYVEKWRLIIVIPHEALSKLIETSIGIHLAAICIVNGLEPWAPECLQSFLKHFIDHLKSNHQENFSPAAETVGMILKMIENDPDFSTIVKNIENQLFPLVKSNLLHILTKISIYYPPIVEKFIDTFISMLDSKSPSIFKIQTLKIMLAKPEITTTTIGFKLLDFEILLNCPDLEVQILSLELLIKVYDKVELEKLNKIIKKSSQFSSSSNDKCRENMFQFVMNCYNLNVDLCSQILIKGLVDSNSNVQNKIYEFLNNLNRDKKTFRDRLSFVLKNLFSPGDMEEHFLGYCSALILYLCKNEREYDEKIFEYELEKCVRENYKPINCWRVQHSAFVPLFASSLKSQKSQWSQNAISNNDVLLATQTDLSFVPTQFLNEDAKKIRSTSTTTSTSESSFSISLYPVENYSSEMQSDLERTTIRKRRICSDKKTVSKICSSYQVKKHAAIKEKREDVVKEREKNVSIYRSYKKGDFPDIQITLSEILIPLEALSKNDSYIARLIFTSVLSDYLTDVRNFDSTFLTTISTSISDILKISGGFVPNLIGALMDFALSNSKFIQIEPEIISNASLSSGLYSIGSLLLEEYLIRLDFSESRSKRKPGEESEENKYWLKVAELYKELNEWDVVTAIFLEKIKCEEIVSDAIVAESTNQWKHAVEFYNSAIETDPSPRRQEFYYESCFKCLANMGQWSDLSRKIEDFTNEDDTTDVWQSLWASESYQKKLLPWYLKAEVNKFLENFETNIISYVNRSLTDPFQSNILKTEFGEELAILFLEGDDLEASKQYIYSKFNSFLGKWSNINSLAVQLKIDHLLNLKNVVDINNFLKMYDNFSVINCKEIVNDLIKLWKKSNENGNSAVLNEMKLLNREKFVDKLIIKIHSSLMDDEEQSSLANKLESFRYDLNINFIEIFTELNNNDLAYKYIRINCSKRDENDLRWYLQFSKMAYKRIIGLENSTEKVSKYLKVWKELNEALSENTNHEQHQYIIRAYELIFDISKELRICFKDNKESFIQNIKELSEIRGEVVNDSEEILYFGWSKFSDTLNKYYRNEDKLKNSKVMEDVGNSFVKLAYFYYEEGGNVSGFIEAILRAMKFGSPEARQLFPCILTIEHLGKNHAELFIREYDAVPLWMFLSWIPQMLASLDTDAIFALKDLILKIAQTYPNSIKYPYRLSRNKYDFEPNDVKLEGEKLLKQLDSLLLNDRLTDELLTAFKYVSIPDTTLQHHLKKLMKVSEEAEFKNCLKNILNEMFPEKTDFKSLYNVQGSLYRNIQKYQNKLSQLLNKSFNVDSFKSELSNIIKELLPKPKSKSKFILNDICPWLNNFRPKDDEQIEIPGQYKGDKLPLPEYHVKIMGFSPEISVMTSVRRPIKISIMGHDAKEYPFLIKSGEDLRQDQRIQQLFSLMNNILNSDRNCNQRRLFIRTYEVIPLTDSVGMIEWVKNTKSLGDFIKESFDNDGKKLFEKLSSKYSAFVQSVSRKDLNGYSEYYGLVAEDFGRDKVITNYKKLVNEIPWDCLRKAFRKICIDSESFFVLRRSFAVSYATMCVSHWILGIGDRHLGNTLIALDKGDPIGIDFGYAFGVSTEALAVPELLPFRLTPQIVNLLKPLNHHGLLEESMINSLRAFRDNKHILLATMNVFIREPSIEWLDFAKNSELTNESQIWYPEQKILHCKEKLEGANPVKIMVEELMAGRSKFSGAYVDLVKGDPRYNFRSKVNNNLSVKEQVKCLLDHATDENILGRQWIGLELWI